MDPVTATHLSDLHSAIGKSPGIWYWIFPVSPGWATSWLSHAPPSWPRPAKHSPAGSSAPFGSAPLAPPAAALSAAARSACLWQRFLHSRSHAHLLGYQGELSGDGKARYGSQAVLLPLNAWLAADPSTFLHFLITSHTETPLGAAGITGKKYVRAHALTKARTISSL